MCSPSLWHHLTKSTVEILLPNSSTTSPSAKPILPSTSSKSLAVIACCSWINVGLLCVGGT
eukprot:CAMPEP_0115715388 /NCGR_PEP_ID=MMETSP0272-20121206/75757_1 /TAXON_ID=71861 /ORGANISM="Scrippsiella trochoidea, Strain CCMP3099" /LENGTH=60 /DNA_ID=CAMNT_0003157619 /DNA_START=33 /DNA_END=212 /DNA_ORIENTATION=-